MLDTTALTVPEAPTLISYDSEALDRFDHARGFGGCWITAAGKFIHVYDYAAHHGTACHLGFNGYYDAYEAGWVRVSMKHTSHAAAFTMQAHKATVPALRALRSILKTVEMLCPTFWGAEDEGEVEAIANDYAGLSSWLTRQIVKRTADERRQSVAAAEAMLLAN